MKPEDINCRWRDEKKKKFTQTMRPRRQLICDERSHRGRRYTLDLLVINRQFRTNETNQIVPSRFA